MAADPVAGVQLLADLVAGVQLLADRVALLVQGPGPGSSLRLTEAGLPLLLEGLMPPPEALSALPPSLKPASQTVLEVAPV